MYKTKLFMASAIAALAFCAPAFADDNPYTPEPVAYDPNLVVLSLSDPLYCAKGKALLGPLWVCALPGYDNGGGGEHRTTITPETKISKPTTPPDHCDPKGEGDGNGRGKGGWGHKGDQADEKGGWQKGGNGSFGGNGGGFGPHNMRS